MTEDKITTEREGKISASGGERLYNCLGSAIAERKALASGQVENISDEAAEGVLIHEALESEDFSQLDESGLTIAQNLEKMREKAVAEWLASIGNPKDVKPTILKEERCWIRDAKGKKIASAKVDYAMIIRPFCIIINFKTGYLPFTPARRNIQARLEALAVASEYSPLIRVRAAMAGYRFLGNYDCSDYSATDLDQAKRELEFNLWRASQTDAPRVPGTWCSWCKAKAYCREAAAYSLLPVPVAKDPKDVVAAVAQLSPADLAFLHSKKALAEKVFEAVDVRLRALPREVLNEVGLDLGTPGSSRSVEDIQKCWQALYAEGMTEEEFRSTCKAVIGRIEAVMVPKIRASRPNITSDAAAKKIVGKIIEPSVETKPKAAPLIPFKKQIEE